VTGDELKASAIELFGEKGWQSSLAEWLQIDRTQIWRYVKNDRVPGPVAAAVTERLSSARSRPSSPWP
jgi:hypothetical protein